MITDGDRELAVAKAETGGLLNQRELGLIFCVSRDYVRAMIKSGFQLFAGKTTCEDALRWLRAHPDFAIRQERLSPKLSRKLPIQRRNGAIRKKHSSSRRRLQSKPMAGSQHIHEVDKASA
jgi:hypothetical protein